jgi:hypothetical protein
MNAAIEATNATDRSMPPVSMVSVWQAARIASGMANFTVVPIHVGFTVPGWTTWRSTTRQSNSPRRGMMGWSRTSGSHAFLRRIATTAPTITTTTITNPSITVV